MYRLLGVLMMMAVPAMADIIIATVGPMTGQYASIGEQMRRGAEKAVMDINAAGGILGEKVILKVADDGCDPKQASLLARQLSNEGVVFVAGHFCSSTSLAAADIYEDQDVLMMTPASTNPALTQKKRQMIFRLCGRDDQQGVVAADYMIKHFKGKKIAIVHDRSSYGKGLADVAKAHLNKAGIREVVFEAITQGDRDFSALITVLKTKGVDVVYLGGYHTEAGLIRRQATEQGLKNLILMSGDALITSEYWTITGKTGEGTLMTFSPDPRLHQAAQNMLGYFKKQGYNPEGYTFYNYATVQIFAAAAKQVGTLDPVAIAQKLKEGGVYQTILGQHRFDKNGDVRSAGYVVYRWHDGAYTYADAPLLKQ
jgi:branched-chain amino acid transport system substrate-binding protein